MAAVMAFGFFGGGWKVCEKVLGKDDYVGRRRDDYFGFSRKVEILRRKYTRKDDYFGL